MSLTIRDDDSELLVDLSRRTGLGRLIRVPAKRTSNPQLRWDIVGHIECLRLADLLDRFPLRGRKRREAAIWSQAVRDLTDCPRPPSLPLAHSQLRALRRYVDPEERGLETVRLTEDALAPYLGGFFTGEGHLSIFRRRCRVVVKVREDDRALLEALAAQTALGSIYLTRAYGTSRPAAAWHIHRRDQMRAAVRLLERAGLRGRKLREFKVWREAARECAKPTARRARSVIVQASAELATARMYPPYSSDEPLEPDPLQEQRRGYVDVLNRAAHCTEGQLTVPADAAARAAHRDWPNRNTIAHAFGSWASALEAAGLGDRCSPRARSKAKQIPRDYTEDQLNERHASRERVLDAVAALILDQPGRPPTVHEFLAHRAAADPALPCLSRLYDLFPGGWRSVLKQAEPRLASAAR